MPQLRSIDQKLSDLEALSEESDLSEWENDFVNSLSAKVQANCGSTTCLTEKQVDKLEEVWLKHFSHK